MSDRAELRSAYRRIRQTLNQERVMRMQVFPEGNPKRERKLAEIDQALADLQLLGEAIREVLSDPPRQLQLLNVPARYT